MEAMASIRSLPACLQKSLHNESERGAVPHPVRRAFPPPIDLRQKARVHLSSASRLDARAPPTPPLQAHAPERSQLVLPSPRDARSNAPELRASCSRRPRRVAEDVE